MIFFKCKGGTTLSKIVNTKGSCQKTPKGGCQEFGSGGTVHFDKNRDGKLDRKEFRDYMDGTKKK